MAESFEQLDLSEKLSVDIVKRRAVGGAAILTLRNVFLQAVAFFATALLTYFLQPSEFGVFFIVSAVVNFLAYFSDIGFAAALIQKKDHLKDEELKTVFSAQQLLILFLIFTVFILSPVLKNFYKLDMEAIYLLWALAISLLFSSLKTIPSVLMERRLEFQKLVIPQIVETLVFNISAVFLAWKGFGVTSFTIAVILRGFSGLIVTYIVQPWVPSLAFSYKAFKSVLKYGIPYQANSLLAMVKDDGITLLLGSTLGAQGIGLLGWAQKWAYAPLRFFMDQVIKVTFPAFSRLQDNDKELSNAVTKSIFFVCALVFPSLLVLFSIAPILVEIIPKYDKWRPALFALTILSINSSLAAITTPLTNTLNAIGKIMITFRLMIMWTILTWAFVPALAILFGVNGAALGFGLVGLSSIFALIIISKYVKIDYFQAVFKPLFATIIMGGFIFIIKGFFPLSILQLIIIIITAILSYIFSLLILQPDILVHLKALRRS